MTLVMAGATRHEQHQIGNFFCTTLFPALHCSAPLFGLKYLAFMQCIVFLQYILCYPLVFATFISFNIYNQDNEMNPLITLLMLPALVLSSMLVIEPALAQQEKRPAWFEIEVIIFKHLNPEPGDSEQWPEAPGFPAIESAIELALAQTDEPIIADTPEQAYLRKLLIADHLQVIEEPAETGDMREYELLQKNKLQLGKLRHSLLRSKNYTPILHFAWRQQGLGREDVQTILVDSSNESLKFQQDLSPSNKVETHTAINETIEIEGTLRISRSRYLHADIDLLYRIEKNKSSLLTSDQSIERFRMTQSRRLRSKEIHYFDHPKFGLILRVIPVKIEEIEEGTIPLNDPNATGDAKRTSLSDE